MIKTNPRNCLTLVDWNEQMCGCTNATLNENDVRKTSSNACFCSRHHKVGHPVLKTATSFNKIQSVKCIFKATGCLGSYYSDDVSDYHPLQPNRPVIICVWNPEDVTDWMSLSWMCVNRRVVSLQLPSISNPALSPQRGACDPEGPGGNLGLWSFKCFLL